MKHLHKFFNQTSTPWVQLVWHQYYSRDNLPYWDLSFRGSFWWRDLLKFLPNFKNLATALVQNGRSCFLWLDTWNQTLWSQACPHLFSFAKSHFVSLHTAVTSEHLEDLFHLPLSAEAFTQFQTLQTALQTLHLSDSHDSWTYSWGMLVSLLGRFTNILLGTMISTVLTNGCGCPLARIRENFSSSSFSLTDWVRECCFDVDRWFLMIILVWCALQMLMKTYYICCSIARLLLHDGTLCNALFQQRMT